ncbi:MAG: UDP-N-acetylmuramate dehydrogenase, partial [Chloroflexota bacterium]|nr:UDP-N-acetylmuramate dehydrogenase [Chloroflexota bacterium]
MSRLRELQARLGPGSRLAEPLARYTSIRAGGQADLFLQARTSEQLVDAVEEAEALGVPWRIIGGASNLLIADAGVEGLVIKAATGGVEIDRDGDPPRVHAAAGCILAAVAKQTALAGFAGLEWAVNVPGTVGASVVNNSGAFGSSTAEHLEHADVYAPGGEVVRMTGEELELAYRTSRLKRGEL